MKTAVSMPDGPFESAEGFARRHRMSRNELYAGALREYLGGTGGGIIERLDAVYAGELAEEGCLDPVLEGMQAGPVPAGDDR